MVANKVCKETQRRRLQPGPLPCTEPEPAEPGRTSDGVRERAQGGPGVRNVRTFRQNFVRTAELAPRCVVATAKPRGPAKCPRWILLFRSRSCSPQQHPIIDKHPTVFHRIPPSGRPCFLPFSVHESVPNTVRCCACVPRVHVPSRIIAVTPFPGYAAAGMASEWRVGSAPSVHGSWTHL